MPSRARPEAWDPSLLSAQGQNPSPPAAVAPCRSPGPSWLGWWPCWSGERDPEHLSATPSPLSASSYPLPSPPCSPSLPSLEALDPLSSLRAGSHFHPLVKSSSTGCWPNTEAVDLRVLLLFAQLAQKPWHQSLPSPSQHLHPGLPAQKPLLRPLRPQSPGAPVGAEVKGSNPYLMLQGWGASPVLQTPRVGFPSRGGQGL